MENLNMPILNEEDEEITLTLDRLLNYARIGIKYSIEANETIQKNAEEKNIEDFYNYRIKKLKEEENRILLLQNSLGFTTLNKDILAFFDSYNIKKNKK